MQFKLTYIVQPGRNERGAIRELYPTDIEVLKKKELYIYIYIGIYTYVYIHTHTHTHTHIYIYIGGSDPTNESIL